MKLFLKILLFVFVSLIANVNVVSAATTSTDIQEITTSSSFHTEIPKTVFKVIENDLANCCQNEQYLVDYRSWGISVIGNAAKGGTNLIPEGKLANHLFKGAGKLADNPANRTLIQKIANGKPLGVDAYGKVGIWGVDGAGKSVYTYTQNGVVKGAGYATMTPAEMIAKYGLK